MADSDTNPVDKLPAILKKDLHRNLCTCMDVLKIDVINAIASGATTVEEVKQQTMPVRGRAVVNNRSNG